ncbi:MAG TPA: hypothetical protein VH518_24875 [Tepidisphaeraceae bacterium]|jgi:tetratricopeptide (TPR) repeat protein
MRPSTEHSPQQGRGFAQALTQLAFVLAIGLVLARATFLENVREPELIAPGSNPVPVNPGPTTGLVFDLLLCVPALLVLLRRVIDPEFRMTLSWSHVVLAALGLWAACSAFWSSDKFGTVVTSSHLIAAAALVWSMTQLMRSWLRLRLVAAGCFALLLVYVAHGITFRLIDVPDNIKYWTEHKEEELRNRGMELGSFQAIQFEKKVLSGEMVGFNASPNTFAAMLVMLGVVSAGVAIQRIVDRDELGWAIAVIIAIGAAVWVLHYTHSKAAYATPFLAAAIMACIALAGEAMARRRKLVFISCAAAFLAGAIGIIGVGLARGGLMNSSLTFRWHYWVGAAKIFEQLRNPFLGTGWATFGLHYVGVRLPIASEEVKDPHNLIVRAFVELGIVGGMLMLAWLARLGWELSAPTGLPANPLLRPATYTPAFTARAILAICVTATVLSIFASVDFNADSADASWFVILQLLKRTLFLGLLLLGFAAVSLRSSKEPRLDDRPAPWVLYGMLAAIAVFLIHNLIDFSLFEPGPMGVFAMLVGAALGGRTPVTETDVDRGRGIPALALITASALWISAALAVVVPIGIAESSAQRGDVLLRNRQARSAAELYRGAYQNLWIPNADYAYRAAMALASSPSAATSANEIRLLLDNAIAANPMNVSFYRRRAELELARESPDAQRVTADFDRAIELDPNDVSGHLDYADALVRLGLGQRAIEQYRTALLFNDQLGPDEPKRLSQAKIEQIRRKMQTLEG